MSFEKVNQLCRKCDILEREAGGTTLAPLENAGLASDVRAGKTFYDENGNIITGTRDETMFYAWQDDDVVNINENGVASQSEETVTLNNE